MTNSVRFLCLVLLLLVPPGRLLAQRAAPGPLVTPRMRVIVDNDFSGDPDGLFQLAHLLLSPSVEIRAIIGSHLRVGDGFDNSATQADNAARKAAELLRVMHLAGKIPVLAGANTAMPNDSTPVRGAAVQAIIREALRTDTQLPLFVLCGAGLTEIASAALTEPRIADRLTLIWIGGPEYPDLALPPPHYTNPEYNSSIDLAAAQALFNRTRLPLWQVPRNAYRQALLPYSQLLTQVKTQGPTGRYLSGTIEALMARLPQYHLHIGETYILGDSPLVLITALQSSFEADPSSSDYVIRLAPRLTAQGTYTFASAGRPIRVYTRLDIPLLFNDFFAKLVLFAGK